MCGITGFVDFKNHRNITIDMGATKTTEFSLKENKLAKYAKALAHPARVSILNLLASKHTCVCGDIVDELPLSQSTSISYSTVIKDVLSVVDFFAVNYRHITIN